MGRGMTRRDLLMGVGAAAAVPLAGGALAAPAGGDVTGQLARYMVSARDRALPEEVSIACKARILDTLGAMISGSRLPAGLEAVRYVQGLGGTEQASVVASSFRTTAVDAALANAMCAHADETDDFDPTSKAHPGSSTVPAALAMAEREGRSGEEVIRAVALGYDMACRLLLALGPDAVRGSHRSTEGTSSNFGALGAAASLARLDELRTRYAISYTAQQVSGLWSWVEDRDHVEKAFDFAMGARNGVTAVSMVQTGMTGVTDVLDGAHNLFIALSRDPHPEAMVEGLGRRFFVTETAIKTFTVGYPIQSVLDAFLKLREKAGLTPQNVRHILVKIPTDTLGIIGDSAMPNVNCQYLVALALIKGTVPFSDSHDEAMMGEPAIRAEAGKVQVVSDPALVDPAAPRGAIVEVTTTDGKTISEQTRFPPGTKENPLSPERLHAKARELIVPVLGQDKADRLIAAVGALETVADLRSLRPLWTA